MQCLPIHKTDIINITLSSGNILVKMTFSFLNKVNCQSTQNAKIAIRNLLFSEANEDVTAADQVTEQELQIQGIISIARNFLQPLDFCSVNVKNLG
jgi:hypothetical protein